MMFPIFTACSKLLQDLLNTYAAARDPVDIKRVMNRFSTDIIGSCAFGLECNSLKDEGSMFTKYCVRVLEPSLLSLLKSCLILMFPAEFLKKFSLRRTNREVEKFFMNMTKETADFREKNNIHRNDFMDLLLQLKNWGQISDDADFQIENNASFKESDGRLSFNEIAAQCYVFFLAGFETSSTTMTFAFYELAKNQDIQDKLRHEILTVMRKHDDKLTIEALSEMTYLDKVIYGKFMLNFET